jgi:hypothetical protein
MVSDLSFAFLKAFLMSSVGDMTREAGPAAAIMPLVEFIASRDEVEGGSWSAGHETGSRTFTSPAIALNPRR